MTEVRKRGRVGILSAAIDPLLLAGGHRVSEIADILVAQFGQTAAKSKIVNNIRSRIVVLQKQGLRLEKETPGRRPVIKLVVPEVSTTIVSA
jgi:hypothetical protein